MTNNGGYNGASIGGAGKSVVVQIVSEPKELHAQKASESSKNTVLTFRLRLILVQPNQVNPYESRRSYHFNIEPSNPFI